MWYTCNVVYIYELVVERRIAVDGLQVFGRQMRSDLQNSLYLVVMAGRAVERR